jgi:predicted protein tyrosine phosphatase
MIVGHAPGRIVSLLDPGIAFPDAGPTYAGRHLRLCFHDIHSADGGYIVPTADHVRVLIAFLTAWDRAAPLLVHCHAGIGRSTATAFIAACLHNPHSDELEIAVALRRVAPLARPNETLVKLADAALARGGRMSRAIAKTGRHLPWIDVPEADPFELPSKFRIVSR